MPYKISASGRGMFKPFASWDLTKLQQKALEYAWNNDPDWFGAVDVAKEYGYPNGQYFRGVLASLHKKGLLIKGD